jgi:hypothetical protein
MKLKVPIEFSKISLLAGIWIMLDLINSLSLASIKVLASSTNRPVNENNSLEK